MHSNFKNKNLKALGIIFTYGAIMLLDKSLRKHTLRMKENKKSIYSWGNGISGQLGVGNESNSESIPKKISEFENINKNIVDLVSSFDVSAAITDKGEVYVWGKTKDGALGIFPGGSSNIDSPILFHHLEHIDSSVKVIDFSKEHGALVTENGRLYTWGVDMHNKLGHKEEIQIYDKKVRSTPKTRQDKIKFCEIKLPNETKAISVKCGYNHTLCLSEDGEVYSWGFGKDGALGHQNFESVSSPKLISYFSDNKIKIQKIQCGDYFCMALSEDGDLYTWGQNSYGQLGLGKITQQLRASTPMKVNFGQKKISFIFSGEDHCACITNDGEGYIWGYGIDGRLGNKIKANSNIPCKINIDDSKINNISCGGHHTAVVTDKGELYMFGNGRDGELGRGDLLESHSVVRDSPLLVQHFGILNEKVVKVSCGSSHTIALTEKRLNH